MGRLLTQTQAELQGRNVSDPERGARTLVAHVFGVPHTRLDSLSDAPVAVEQAQRVGELAQQTLADAPVAYLVGEAPFLDWDFFVSRDTLIPKRDTELFVAIVLDQIAGSLPPDAHVLELCAGSGCLAISLAKRLPGARIVATDISEAALAVARRNVARHALEERVALGQGDLFAPVEELMGDKPFDLIVSNPPYIPTKAIPDMGAHVADHEPHLALDGGNDGLDPHRRILAQAFSFLAPGGRIFLEHEHYQGQAGCALALAHPAQYEDVRTLRDANGKDRALHARRPAGT